MFVFDCLWPGRHRDSEPAALLRDALRGVGALLRVPVRALRGGGGRASLRAAVGSSTPTSLTPPPTTESSDGVELVFLNASPPCPFALCFELHQRGRKPMGKCVWQSRAPACRVCRVLVVCCGSF